jgi:hypothetical protein
VTFKVDPEVEAACRVKNKPIPALPSPSLLAIRAAFSRVAHMAGAAEQVDQILRDLEETPVMAEDGSTMDLLTSRLLQVVISCAENTASMASSLTMCYMFLRYWAISTLFCVQGGCP